MTDDDLRFECLRLAVGYYSNGPYDGPLPVALAEQFFRFVKNGDTGTGTPIA